MTRGFRVGVAASGAVLTVMLFGAVRSPVGARQAGRDAGVSIGTARIAGVVVADGETPPRPIRHAIVTITGTGLGTPRQAVTDDSGQFAFVSLPAGRFSVTAEKPAYLKSYYGNRTPGHAPGMPIAIAEAQRIENVTIPLARGAAFGGRFTDPSGAPMAGAQVQISLVTFVDGQRKFVNPPAGTNNLTTDDRGAYRAYGLLPGDYIVRAVGGGGGFSGSPARVMTSEEMVAALRQAPGPSPPPLRPVARIATYFPNVSDIAMAQTIALAAGDDRTDVNIVCVFGVRAAVRVSGMAIGPDGEPLTNISVGIANLTAGSMYSSMGAVRPGADGRFSVGGLAPGRWLLFGRGAPADAPTGGPYPWWTETEVPVGDQDVTGVALRFERGVTVTGQLVFRGTQPPPDLSRLRVTLAAVPAIVDTAPPIAGVAPRPDGTFAIENVPAGKYRVVLSPAGAWSLRSATAAGRDTLDQPLEVGAGQSPALTLTLTDRPTEISGVLRDQLGRPAPEYSVVVFAADRELRTTAPRRNSGVVKVASDGRYRVIGLPPGDYVLCVLTDVEPRQIQDPSFLDQLAAVGMHITLGEGEQRVMDLKIGAGGGN